MAALGAAQEPAERLVEETLGALRGQVLVHGRDTARHRPRDLADVVGYVGQDPLRGFVTDTVEVGAIRCGV